MGEEHGFWKERRLSVRAVAALVTSCVLMLLIAAMADHSGWWSMCDKSPCGAVITLSGELPKTCEDQEVLAQEVFLPGQPLTTCSEADRECKSRVCMRVFEHISSGGLGDVASTELACLRSKKSNEGTSEVFGHLCCSVCMEGALGMPAFVFARWSDRQLSCGLFTCVDPSIQPASDWCPDRAKHIRVAQAFSIIACVLIGLVLAVHGFDIICVLLQRSSAASRRLPLPQRVRELQPGPKTLSRLGIPHGCAAACCFIAACAVTAGLSQRLCGTRFSEHAQPGTGVYMLWILTAVETIIAVVMGVAGAGAAPPQGGSAAAARPRPEYAVPDSATADTRPSPPPEPLGAAAAAASPEAMVREHEIVGSVELTARSPRGRSEGMALPLPPPPPPLQHPAPRSDGAAGGDDGDVQEESVEVELGGVDI
eukprot:TRINITY_DN12080_c2_g1_i1.p1 TRINITY_DN12080_c2_g1~~TRINITY_DN12080_c2_g1_i1.p1  ORF type:complete len:425 (+),score=110.14 TRINITY_DN12080_c2_g1_i1:55-1329(+)